MWVRPDILYVQITGVIPESIEENTYKRYTYPEVPTQKYLPRSTYLQVNPGQVWQV